MKKTLLVSTLIFTLLLTGCSNADEPVADNNSVNEYPFEIINSKDIVEAEILLENGKTISLDLYPNIAPVTVSNFIHLAKDKFYDGLIFHRVIEGFMIQGGCPNGIGNGDPNYRIEGEFSANGFDNPLHHTRGVISMARSNNSYDSAGSQFFIMHKDAPSLDGQYAAFGRVTDGMDAVDEIAATETDGNDKPINEVKIKTINIK